MSVGGVVGADDDLARSPVLDPAVEQRDRRADVGGVHPHQPGRRADRGQVLLEHQPAAVQHADPGTHLLDLGEQVAGQEDRRARPVQVEQQLADVPDALRVQAVGRLVEHEKWRAAHQRGRQAQPLAHPQGVRLHRTSVAGVQSHLLEHLGHARTTGRPADPAASGRVEEGQVGRAGQVGVGTGPLDERAHVGEHRRRRPWASADRRSGCLPRWPAPARAASGRWWSCRSRWRRGSRRRRPPARRGRPHRRPGRRGRSW